MGRIDENTSVLRCDNGIDDGSKIVDIGECLDAQDNVIERALSGMSGIFGISNNYTMNQRVSYHIK
jgi:hypothetical protein